MNEPTPGPERTRAGCVAAGALFAIVAILGWLMAITVYGLVVEQWEMIQVRREFSSTGSSCGHLCSRSGWGLRQPSLHRGAHRRRE